MTKTIYLVSEKSVGKKWKLDDFVFSSIKEIKDHYNLHLYKKIEPNVYFNETNEEFLKITKREINL